MQRADGRQRFHPVWSGWGLERIEQHPAIGSYLIDVLLALLLLFRQPFMIEPFSIALDPADWYMGTNPIGSYLGEHIQDIDHGLSHA